jgi:deoxyribodipyrimidine photolyase-related protein
LIFDNEYIKEAKTYVKKFNTVGSVKEFYHPITFDEVRENFDYFLKNKFEKYGDYQDAIVKGESFLYHSNISSALNAGLLSLKDVIQKIYDADVSLNSKEGFIRQIIGWREFMFSIYKSSHITLRNSNFF